MTIAKNNDYGPHKEEFPETEWLLHHFTIYDGTELDDDGKPYRFDGPEGRYFSGSSHIEDEQRQVSIQLWNELEEKGGWGPNEHLEVHVRHHGGDWQRLTSNEIVELAEEYKPVTYWWVVA